VVTTHPNLNVYRLRTQERRSLRRLGSGVLTGAATALTITLSPATATAAEASSSTTAPSSAAQTAVDTARAQVGKAYEYGGAGPDSFDCSGLTQYAYRAAGIELPHSSRSQSTMGTQVSRSELLPGDLVFFYTPISHVGLYIGDGMMVHARTFGSPVAVTSVDQRGFRFGVRLG
jgi:cell wall-associated NlpC family hydrolase